MTEVSYSEHDLAVIRGAYARQILAAGITDDSRLEEALAAVRRERFLGPPPWAMVRHVGGRQLLPTSDPAVLYQDALFALAPGQGINNGSPSLHAGCLHALSLQEGERVVHLGAGTGYYTALLAHLVGDAGHVLAVEFDPALADLARAHLAGRRNVTVVSGDGAEWPQEAVDAG